MAIKTYRALSSGTTAERFVAEGEVFSTEFREIVREQGVIQRDADGKAVTRVAKEPPSWVEELAPKKAKQAKQESSQED